MTGIQKQTKDLERQIKEKDAELEKLQTKMNKNARDTQKEEMRRVYDVLRHLKKKVGA